MDISDAFEAKNIENSETALTDEEHEDLRGWLSEIVPDFMNNVDGEPNIEFNNMAIEVASLAFVAGRTYQVQREENPVVNVPMDITMLAEFLEFTLAKIQSLEVQA